MRKARLAAGEIKRERESKAAIVASILYGSAPEAPSEFPYLVAKQVQRHTARLVGDRLALPIQDFSGNLTSLQFISRIGDKRMLTGGRKKGCFIPIDGQPGDHGIVIVCEGWATGATLAEEYPTSSVIAAIDAGNLKSVATGAAIKWPNAELVVAGDDDRSTSVNIGREKASEAAKLAGAKLVFPQWPEGAPLELSDFNDLALYQRSAA
ncbi:MAG: hypothetical protein HKN50_02590 [Gammaproteobacteria bacterium]|nr:hypothetical protein [Gammaproteobacteria bacterium]